MFSSVDISKLLLRLLVGAMMLFHGIDKMLHGISGVQQLTVNAGLPAFVAYGVFIGEVIVPVFIILGIYARIASLFLALNMAMAIFLAYGNTFLSLGKHGAPLIELPLFYFVLAIVIFLLGSGKYAVNSK
jgi:putative oxidoreductase